MYHFDLKIYRGSSRKNGKINTLNVLNIFSNKYGICMEREMIEKRSKIKFRGNHIFFTRIKQD